MISRWPEWLRDVVERAVWTFVQTFLGALSVESWTDLGAWKTAAAAGVAAALSVLKNAVRRRKEVRNA